MCEVQYFSAMYRGGVEPNGRETEEQAGATQLKRCILNIRLQVFQQRINNYDRPSLEFFPAVGKLKFCMKVKRNPIIVHIIL